MLHRGSLDGIWAAASVTHLSKVAVRVVLDDLLDVMQHGGVLAATVAHGLKSRDSEARIDSRPLFCALDEG